uniref:SLC12 domain-containing protein n=1 Tax=Globodera pallida TaxID=36090 RepID=A0A183C0Y5_GLOPA
MVTDVPMLKITFFGISMEIFVAIVPGIGQFPLRPINARQIDTILRILAQNVDKSIRADNIFDEGIYNVEQNWHSNEMNRLNKELQNAENGDQALEIVDKITVLNGRSEMLAKERAKDTNGGPMCPIGINGGKVHSAVEDGQSAEYSPNARRATMGAAGDSSQNQFTMARTKLAELIRMRARKSFRTARKASAMLITSYNISRSLGPEFGGSIGLILYIANTVNASMNCVGLAEAMVRLLKDDYGIQLIDGGINDIRIYAICTCLLLQAIIFIGTEFENKTQLALMGTIWVCIVSHFVGTLLPLNEVQRHRGVVGFSFGVLLDNLWPDFRNGKTFITMFGVYFPAMTGDLKDPSKSIPRGTFWAIAITTLTYLWCMVVTAMTTLRDANGYSEPELHPVTHRYIPASCRANITCKFGLANDYDVMTLQGAWAPLITVGVFSTTLSSASGCLIGAPRILLCHRKTNDPFRAYILTLLIAISAIMIGELNSIADLISNFFLAAFAITNFACFDASAAKSPGFRPGFRFYNKWLSLFGSALCVLIMFVLNWLTSLVTFLVFFVLFVFIKHNKSHINWGTSTEANRYRRALNSLLKISRTEDHVKNYRPQLLLLCGHIVPHRSSVQATALIRSLNNRFTDWLYEQHIKGFYCAVAHQSLRDGVQCLLQTVGLGKMHPNILLIGFNSHWLGHVDDWYKEYMGVIADAFEANMAVCVFRNENDGLDHSALLSEEDKLFVRLPDLLLSDRNSSLIDDLNRGVGAKKVRPKAKAQQQSALSFSPFRAEFSAPTLIDRLPTTQRAASPSGGSIKANGHAGGETTAAKGPRKVSSGAYMRKNDQFRSAAGRHPMSAKFRTQIKGGFVDVWWLHDDGGLALLLSHLLKEHNTYLPNAKLRIFTICSKLDPDDVYHKLVEMLKKFRIHFTSVHVISEDYDEEKLYQETIEEYQELMNTLNPPGKEQHEQAIHQEMIDKTQWKTMRYLRQRELLLEFSSASSIVMISMPFASASVQQGCQRRDDLKKFRNRNSKPNCQKG